MYFFFFILVEGVVSLVRGLILIEKMCDGCCG